jgi:transcriptional regulator with XRE-family HTH domain
MNCYRCKKETKLKKVQKYKYFGISPKNVYLNNIEVRICENCELTSPLIPNIIRLHNTIARAIICQKSLLLGEEVRFLRKNLRLKAQDWAKCLRKDAATISRAEKDGNVLNKDLDLLIRLAYVRFWEEKNETIFSEKIVETLTIVEDIEQSILIDVEKIEEFSHFEKEDVLEKEFLYDWNFDQPNQNAVLLSVTKTKIVNNRYATYTNFASASEEILSCGISFSS